MTVIELRPNRNFNRLPSRMSVQNPVPDHSGEPHLYPFCENRRERVIPEDVVMLVHDHKVWVLARVTFFSR
jgi:hypothetical protein